MYECFNCGMKAVIWDSDFSFEDVGLEGEGIVHFCHCTHCGARVEYYVGDKEEDGCYISKQAAINEVRSYYDECDERKEPIEERIEQLPSADVVSKEVAEEAYAHGYTDAKMDYQPKQGRWETDGMPMDDGEYLMTRCTVCGTAYEYGHNENYCGYCGARMDGEQNE